LNLGQLSNVDHSRDFTGSADSDMSNSLSGNISVTVSDVLPNGVLVIRGEKWLTLNRGEEFIRIRGLVRAEDIAADNTISSTLIADARITYSGTGELADTNRQGWLTRFFNSVVWPF
ncbi:MAG TPA: flagellar basal body L-ring protein FlgH, partial [Pseudomonadales bacterium]|nr:flagellar basal body L-ring protein FlgH [Pseudomonadales bacterium]